jgi:hypothetical protein
LPFDVLLPRIEAFEREVGSLRVALSNLRGTTDNLSRTWLRTQNEVARLTDIVSEQAVQQRLLAVEQRLQNDLEERRRVNETLRFLLDRVEFAHREMLFERGRASGYQALGQAQRKILEPRSAVSEKIAAAQASGKLLLNIGCGQVIDPDYINIDMRDRPGVDLIADPGALPFDPASVDEISCRHIVEQFPQHDFEHRLLPHWRSLLKPGGRFRVVSPDGEAMLFAVTQGSYSFGDLRDFLFGRQNCDEDFHCNLFTPESLCQITQEAGFEQIEIPVRGHRNGQCFQFELIARRPTFADAN